MFPLDISQLIDFVRNNTPTFAAFNAPDEQNYLAGMMYVREKPLYVEYGSKLIDHLKSWYYCNSFGNDKDPRVSEYEHSAIVTRLPDKVICQPDLLNPESRVIHESIPQLKSYITASEVPSEQYFELYALIEAQVRKWMADEKQKTFDDVMDKAREADAV
jgi:hypothetical protein